MCVISANNALAQNIAPESDKGRRYCFITRKINRDQSLRLRQTYCRA